MFADLWVLKMSQHSNEWEFQCETNLIENFTKLGKFKGKINKKYGKFVKKKLEYQLFQKIINRWRINHEVEDRWRCMNKTS